MEKVEADLSRSKSLREKQSKEFSWQLEELKQRYEQQVRGFVLGVEGAGTAFPADVDRFLHLNPLLALPSSSFYKGKIYRCAEFMWWGKSLRRKYFCFLFAILCTSGSCTFFPRLTGGNTCFCNGHVRLLNVLSVFVLVKKQRFILFLSFFNTGSVRMNACFGPLIMIFFIIMWFQVGKYSGNIWV